MADESAAKQLTENSKEFSNVEFLESSTSDPLNVLRSRLKDLSDLPEGCKIRRILVITDIVGEDSRGVDMCWSADDDECPYGIKDNLISMLSRIKHMLTESE